jgi:hypothetical protein
MDRHMQMGLALHELAQAVKRATERTHNAHERQGVLLLAQEISDAFYRAYPDFSYQRWQERTRSLHSQVENSIRKARRP